MTPALAALSLLLLQPAENLTIDADASLALLEPITMDPMTIVGDPVARSQIAGASTVIDEETRDRFHYPDIQQSLRRAPGVFLQLEDGFGLRPNISIRGVPSERSARITLLEDGIPIAPAPYSAPAAYYFPTAGRIQRIEILKGPAAITQGPFTIGGALNLVGTSIPMSPSGRILVEGGSDATWRAHAYYGGQEENFGYLLETHQWRSGGFQDIDRSDADTGLDKRDYRARLNWQHEGETAFHRVTLGLGRATEESEQSYLGLTDTDFATDPLRRYGLSELDEFDAAHKQAWLRYEAQFDRGGIAVTAYNNEFERDWFKTEGIDLDGSDNANDFDRTSWFSVIQAINRGEDINGTGADQLQAILDGADTLAGAIQLRSNNREYYSRGIDLRGKIDFSTFGIEHLAEVGVRYHEDEEDRLQRNSSYTQLNGSLVLDDFGDLGNAGNRIQEAEALAIFLRDTATIGRFTFNAGLRYEDIDQRRTDFGADPTDLDGRNPEDIRRVRENQTDVLLPGGGVVFRAFDGLEVLAGVHEGFTAPPNSPGVEEETAVNYEIGLRATWNGLRGELIGFVSDYDNLLGICTASSGADCEIGDAFNGDAATIRGVEVDMGYDLPIPGDLRYPLRLTYTYLDGEFDTAIADTEFFGDVQPGDPIPYVPENQVFFEAGVEAERWRAYLNVFHASAACTRPSCGPFEQTDSLTEVDLSAHYRVWRDLEAFARIGNLTNSEAIVGRQPYGARPNRSRNYVVGISLGL